MFSNHFRVTSAIDCLGQWGGWVSQDPSWNNDVTQKGGCFLGSVYGCQDARSLRIDSLSILFSEITFCPVLFSLFAEQRMRLEGGNIKHVEGRPNTSCFSLWLGDEPSEIFLLRGFMTLPGTGRFLDADMVFFYWVRGGGGVRGDRLAKHFPCYFSE